MVSAGEALISLSAEKGTPADERVGGKKLRHSQFVHVICVEAQAYHHLAGWTASCANGMGWGYRWVHGVISREATSLSSAIRDLGFLQDKSNKMPDAIQIGNLESDSLGDLIQLMIVARLLRCDQQGLNYPRQKVIHSKSLAFFVIEVFTTKVQKLPFVKLERAQSCATIGFYLAQSELHAPGIETRKTLERSFHQNQMPAPLEDPVDLN